MWRENISEILTFYQKQSVFPHLFSFQKYPSIFVFQFCSKILCFLISYIVMNLTFCYYYVNCIILQTTTCICDCCVKFPDFYVLIMYLVTMVNVLLHSDNLIIQRVSDFRQFYLQIFVVLFLASWSVNI